MDSYNNLERALSGTIDDADLNELVQELNELLSGPGGGAGGSPEEDTGAPATFDPLKAQTRPPSKCAGGYTIPCGWINRAS